MMRPFGMLTRALLVTGILFVSSTYVLAQEDAPPAEPPTDSDPLMERVNEAFDVTSRRFLEVEKHTPWQIMHGILSYRHEYRVKKQGEKINALEWVASGPQYRGDDWFEKTRYGGRAHPFTKPYAFEGHPNQFLAIMTMSDLPLDFQFKAAGGETITIADMVENAQKDISPREEITWTLWALSHYLTPDAEWESKWGESWSIERLVRMQTQAPVYSAACGGTHGMFALTYARNKYLETGEPLRGVWIEADQKIRRYTEEARQTQNRDGTFSGRYFQGRQYPRDYKTKVGTSGHVLEFLMLALPDERLKESWVRHGVYAVAEALLTHRRDPLEPGAMYHALDGLVIYRERVSPSTEEKESQLAEAPESSDSEEADDATVDEDFPELEPSNSDGE